MYHEHFHILLGKCVIAIAFLKDIMYQTLKPATVDLENYPKTNLQSYIFSVHHEDEQCNIESPKMLLCLGSATPFWGILPKEGD